MSLKQAKRRSEVRGSAARRVKTLSAERLAVTCGHHTSRTDAPGSGRTCQRLAKRQLPLGVQNTRQRFGPRLQLPAASERSRQPTAQRGHPAPTASRWSGPWTEEEAWQTGTHVACREWPGIAIMKVNACARTGTCACEHVCVSACVHACPGRVKYALCVRERTCAWMCACVRVRRCPPQGRGCGGTSALGTVTCAPSLHTPLRRDIANFAQIRELSVSRPLQPKACPRGAGGRKRARPAACCGCGAGCPGA